MATVKIIAGKGTCQHITVEITDGDETRRFSMLREEIEKGEQDKDKRFNAILTNLKTNVMLGGVKDWTMLKTSLDKTTF